MVVFTDLPSWNLSIHPNNGMDPRRTLLIVVMNRIIQPEIFCEDLQWLHLEEYLFPIHKHSAKCCRISKANTLPVIFHCRTSNPLSMTTDLSIKIQILWRNHNWTFPRVQLVPLEPVVNWMHTPEVWILTLTQAGEKGNSQFQDSQAASLWSSESDDLWCRQCGYFKGD